MKCQLYRHFNADGDLLYVGTAIHAIWRLEQHRRDASWFLEIATITIQNFDSELAAREAESIAIRTELPKHNRTGFGERVIPRGDWPGREHLARAISIAGSMNRLALLIGRRRQAVFNWLRRDASMPADAALLIEKATGGKVRCHELRPDLFHPDRAAA